MRKHWMTLKSWIIIVKNNKVSAQLELFQKYKKVVLEALSDD